KLIDPEYFAHLRSNNQQLLVPRQHIGIGSQVYYNTLNLTGHFHTFGLAHTLLMGTDFNQTGYDFDAAVYGDNATPTSNLYHPVHNNGLGALNYTLLQANSESWYGIYLQDQISLPYDLHALAGVRYDNAAESLSNNATAYPESGATRTYSKAQDSAVIPRFGLLWQPIETLSLYGNYTENFGLSNVAFSGFGNQPLHAETASQWETGIKTQWLDGKLGASLAAFKITKHNIATLNPACLSLSLTCYAPLGAVQSRGLEFDLKGEILPHWQLIGTYTYLETEVLNDVDAGGGPGDTGRPLIWVDNPRNMGSLWTTYEWTHGSLAGLTLGGGTLLRGPLQSAVGEPGYGLVNLMAAYSLPLGASRLTAQINVDNLFNKAYWLGTDWTGWNEYPGTPRTVLGSLRLEF
ncbi:MAG: TonB-dependent receptor, partial [Methylococcus sp.]|nr:TonB-dependent receptor [Methylococcus sp.]